MPGKLTAFDTDIHVPLVVTGPGVRPGSTTNVMAENVDLAKTFAAIGGGEDAWGWAQPAAGVSRIGPAPTGATRP